MKKESNIKQMLLALFLTTFISAFGVGVVAKMTRSPIERVQQNKQQRAIQKVIPSFDHIGTAIILDGLDGRDGITFYPAFDKHGKLCGVAAKTYSYQGYSGYISLMVGFSLEGTVTGYYVLEHQETPGLGSHMKTWFCDTTNQSCSVIGKNPSSVVWKVSKDGGDIDAITAATISSRAFLQAIEQAHKLYNDSIRERFL